MIGFQNQLTLKNWFFIVQGDYGDYFVNSKGSFMINVVAYYRLSNLLSFKAGWADWDIKHRGTLRREDLKVEIHLSGPAMGLSFHF